MEKTTKKNEKLIKVLQILSALFMLSMVVTMLVLMKKLLRSRLSNPLHLFFRLQLFLQCRDCLLIICG